MQNVEAVYPLTPVQQGMLFECLYAPGGDMYRQHFHCTLRGPLDAASFTDAWQAVLARHGALRTFFVWEGVEQPVQVVRRRVHVSIAHEDASGQSPAVQDARVAAYLEEDRERGFVLGQPPLMRWWLLERDRECHDFVWSTHHLLLDGWSTARVLDEVIECYAARQHGTARAQEWSRQFRDYVVWLQQQDQMAPERFWRATLAGFRTPTDIGGRPRATTRQYGAVHTLTSPELAATLTEAARRAGVTLSTLMQAAWGIVLTGRSGSDDVVFGATTAGRPPSLHGVENIVGVFINTLPVRVRIGGGTPVDVWLRALQAQQVEARQFEHAPLVSVHGWSEVPRGGPLFESILVFENYPLPAGMKDAALGSHVRVEAVQTIERTHYPLTVMARVDGVRGVPLTFLYDLGQFERSEVEQLGRELTHALESLARGGGERVDDLVSLGAEDRRHQIRAWNPIATMSSPGTVVDWIWASAAPRPTKTAVSAGAETLTYGELCERSEAVAHELVRRGIGPECVVGLASGRTVGLVVALLGILRSGAMYLPLDSGAPDERLASMVAAARAGLIVTSRDDRRSWPVPTLVLDDVPHRAPATTGTRVVDAAQGAYVMFTSGSTGQPKGVVVSHGALGNAMQAFAALRLAEEADTLLAATPIAFDISLLELLLPLITGGHLRLAETGVGGGATAIDLLQTEDITVVQTTPSHWRLLMESGWMASSRLRALCGGEPLPADLARQLLRARVELWNVYGPTETTIWSSAERIRDAASPISVGRPLLNTRFYIVDTRDRLAPIRATGELLIGGEGVARGYVGQPDLSAERFVPDGFSDVPGARLYRTGDLARYTADGRVEILGRRDGQLKIRGIRVEPEEVECRLRAHPDVREAAVLGVDVDGRFVLRAYIVTAPGAPLDPHAMRAFLLTHLPAAMVPTSFVALGRLPMTDNGKLDRRALTTCPLPVAVADSPGEQSGVEETLSRIWCDALGVSRVGLDDNFFDIGGHSLLALDVRRRIRQRMGEEIPLVDLFAYPTVRTLAERMGGLRPASTAEAAGRARGERRRRLEHV